MIDRNSLSRFGIGAWGIGGFAEKEPDNDDEKQIQALVYQFERGMNLTEINFWNSQGRSVELIKQALDRSDVSREDIFIVQAIYNYDNETLDKAREEFRACLELFETDYVDSIEFPLSAVNQYGLDPLIGLVSEFLESGRARYTSVTNFNLEYLKKYHAVFGDKLFSHELHYSFEIRENEDNDVIPYGEEHNIITVPFQALRRNRTAQREWPLLIELAEKYQKTQNQIILNWLTARGFHPLVKSETIEHIDENLAALEFEMEQKDLDRLSNFRPPGYSPPEVDWFMKSEHGVSVHALPNVFDDIYGRL